MFCFGLSFTFTPNHVGFGVANPTWLVTPRVGEEHKSVTQENKKGYESKPIQGWPESGPKFADLTKNSPELLKLIKAWLELPEHIKTAVKAFVQNHNSEIK